MNETLNRVVSDLENFPDLERKIDLLRFELEHRATASAGELIGALAFGHGEGIGGSNAYISDKTAYIALNYQEKLRTMNADTVGDIASSLWKLEQERNRIEHYISLLDTKDANIIRMFYFERLQWSEIAEKLGVSRRTAYRLKSGALTKLCEMYEFTSRL